MIKNKTMEETKEVPQPGADPAQKKLMRQNAKMLSLVLMEVNNRFRSVFAEGDADEYKQALTDDLDQRLIDGTVKAKDMAKNKYHIGDLTIQYRQQNKALNDTLLRTVNGYTQAMTEEGRNKFLAIADNLQLLVIEMNNSKNPKGMLSACQLYNAGVFDKALEEVEQMRNKSGLSVPEAGLVDLQGNKL